MAEPDFQIFVSDLASTPEEWGQALNAPSKDLPELSEEQKAVAKKFGISNEDYARGLKAGLLGNARQRKRAEALGEEVKRIITGLGQQYRLLAVFWEESRLRWLLRVQTPDKIVGVPVSFELADDVLDSGILSEIERLRRIILNGIGREDLVPKRS